MSTIIVLKENDVLVVGSDSRVMNHDWSGIASDAMPKVVEIGSGACIVTSGYVAACEFQHQKARELATQLGTTDIWVIGEALERESISYLKESAEAMPSVKGLHGSAGIGDVLSGKKLLHACVLAGRTACGALGYVVHQYRIRAGQVVCEVGEYHGSKRQMYVTAGELVIGLAQEPTTWTDDPVRVVQRFLVALKQAHPHIGGPDQIMLVDRSGTRWISRLPEAVKFNAQSIQVGGSGLEFNGGGGILITDGAGGVNAITGTGMSTSRDISSRDLWSQWGLQVGGVTPTRVIDTARNAYFTSVSVSGSTVINPSKQFVGAGVNCPSYGVACAAVNVNDGVQRYGRTVTLYDRDGNEMVFRGGVLCTT